VVSVSVARASRHWGEVLKSTGSSGRKNQETQACVDDADAVQVRGTGWLP